MCTCFYSFILVFPYGSVTVQNIFISHFKDNFDLDLFSLFTKKKKCLLYFKIGWRQLKPPNHGSSLFSPQHTTKECNGISLTCCWVWLWEWIAFCSRMSCYINVHCDKQMVLISQGGEFACRIPPLHSSNYCKENMPHVSWIWTFMEGGDIGRDFQDDYCCCSPLLFGDHPKAAKIPTPQLQGLQLQVLNGILQRPINMNLLENIAFSFSASGHQIWAQLVYREMLEHIQKCLVLSTFC